MEVNSAVIWECPGFQRQLADEITAYRDVQGDYVTPSIKVYCIEHKDFLTALRIFFCVVGCCTTVLSSFYLSKCIQNCSELSVCLVDFKQIGVQLHFGSQVS